MSVIAFDLSLTGTGWAYWNAKLREFATLSPPKKMDGMERLDWIMTGCRDIVIHRGPLLVVFEDLAFAAFDREHQRAGLAVMLRWRLWRDKVPYILVAPTTLKKFVTGKGKGDKSKIMMRVYKRWHHDVQDDNQADAIGLAYIGATVLGMRMPKNKAEQEVVKLLSNKYAHLLAGVKLG